MEAESMAWSDLVERAPVLAQSAQQILESHPHHVIATTRPDGSPRVGGTNVFFTDGQLWIGAMPAARRNGDLRRDPRCAIHSAPLDEHLVAGDVRLDLVARELIGADASAFLRSTGREGEGVVFLLDVARLSLVRVENDELVVEVWQSVDGVRTTRLR